MPTLLPTVKAWAEGTDWKVESVSYDYSANIITENHVGGNEPALLQGETREHVIVTMVAAGMRDRCPKIPMSCPVSNGYAGTQTLLIRSTELEYEINNHWDDHPLLGGKLLAQNGITTFTAKGVLVA